MSNTAANHTFDRNTLTFTDSGHVTTFPWPIADVLDYGEVLIVRLNPAPGSCFNENILGVGPDGRTIWHIPRRTHVYQDSPYTACLRTDEGVKVSNWDGGEMILEPRTGSVISETYGK